MKIRMSVVGFPMALVMLLAASAVQASITTTYPGSVCVQHRRLLSSTTLYLIGSEVASTSGSVELTCPISQQGATVLSASVSGHNYVATSVRCSVAVTDKLSESGFSTPSVASVTTPGFRYTMALPALPTFSPAGARACSVRCPLERSTMAAP